MPDVPLNDYVEAVENPLWNKLSKWLRDTENSLGETKWREESAEDYRFYAGDQDDQDTKDELTAQNRPDTTYNEIKPKIDMIVGLAATMTESPSFVPRGAEDQALAELIKEYLFWKMDQMRTARKHLECFEHMSKGGRSYLLYHIDSSNPFKPIIKHRRLPGHWVWPDPDAREYDLSDGRFFFIDQWFTEEEIKAYWPDFDTYMIQTTSSSYGEFPVFWDEAREKYRIVEAWYKELVKLYWVSNPITGEMEGLTKDELVSFRKQMADGMAVPGGGVIQGPVQVITTSFKWKWYFALLAGSGMILAQGPSPFKFDGPPIVPFMAYRDEDYNRAISSIESMKDPQRGLNNMRRQLVHLLHTSPKGILVHEAGAIINEDEYDDKSAQPNFRLELVDGAMSKVKFTDQPQISPVYSQLDASFSQAIKDTGGVQDDLMGRYTSSREPGITVQMRQETGLAVLHTLFENYRESKRLSMKMLLSLCQQYMTEKEIFRVTGQKGMMLAQMNSQMNPQMPGFNDLSFGEYDIIFNEEVETRSTRMAVMKLLTDFNQASPGTIPPGIILEYSNLPFSAKQQIQQHFEAQQQIAAEQADREYQLEQRKLDIEEKKARSSNGSK